MSRAHTVGVLHPGQMGAAVAAQLRRGGARVLWCPAGRSSATTQRAARAGLEPVAGLAELLDTAGSILSICPPAFAEQVAEQVARCGFAGCYVDANAISTQRLGRIAERLTAAGSRVLDGAIIGPPPADGTPARLYLAGAPPDVEAVAERFAGTAVQVVAMTSGLGAASALKMAYAGYQKATRTLAGLAHALAAGHGVTDHLLAEAARMTTSPLAELDYLRSVAPRAWRWRPEMLEVADTLGADGLPTDLARATATVLDHWDTDRDRWDMSLREVLERLRSDPDWPPP